MNTINGGIKIDGSVAACTRNWADAAFLHSAAGIMRVDELTTKVKEVKRWWLWAGEQPEDDGCFCREIMGKRR